MRLQEAASEKAGAGSVPVGRSAARLRRSAIPLVVLVLMGLLGATSAAGAPPTLVVEPATEIGFTTARAHGIITPGAQEAFYRFEYIPDTVYRRNVAEGNELFAGATSDGVGWLPASSTPVALAPLLGEAGALEPGIEYHLRLVAENAEGSAIAVAPNFNTPKPLEPIPCNGDSCQVLPPEPQDPTLSTTVAGLGNPKVHYSHYGAKAKSHKKHRRHKKHRTAKKKSGARSSSEGTR